MRLVSQESENEAMVYWKFQTEDKKSFDTLVQLRVLSDQDQDQTDRHGHTYKGTTILAMNTVDESDLSVSLDLIVKGTGTGAYTTRRVLETGLISIRPMPFGQSLLAMSANAYFEGARASSARAAGHVFDHISMYFAERFQNDKVIDDRRRQDFLVNHVPKAPKLTGGEKKLIERSLNYEVELLTAPRTAGEVLRGAKRRAENASIPFVI